jgi:hypothetical protein
MIAKPFTPKNGVISFMIMKIPSSARDAPLGLLVLASA